ncbi:MAG: hypothetical protein KKE84_11840, partial [Gammaproteobacteria bacterium]|nr:hypothetical protein [Gammaproteobacteria bacterium]
ASGLLSKYWNMKRRLFPHGVVARRCHRASYVASSRLALRKNPSVSLVPLFRKQTTSGMEAHFKIYFLEFDMDAGYRDGERIA